MERIRGSCDGNIVMQMLIRTILLLNPSKGCGVLRVAMARIWRTILFCI